MEMRTASGVFSELFISRNLFLRNSNQLAEVYLKRADYILLGESGGAHDNLCLLVVDLLQYSH